jgi:hypothetical protein
MDIGPTQKFIEIEPIEPVVIEPIEEPVVAPSEPAPEELPAPVP